MNKKGVCKKCGSEVNLISRVVGYLSSVNLWNSSKVEELKERRKGKYKVG